MTKQQLIRRLGEQAIDLVDGYNPRNLRAEVTLHMTSATIRVHTKYQYRSFVYEFLDVKWDSFDGTILGFERPLPR